jgi:hypothetical protein
VSARICWIVLDESAFKGHCLDLEAAGEALASPEHSKTPARHRLEVPRTRDVGLGGRRRLVLLVEPAQERRGEGIALTPSSTPQSPS